MTQPIPLYEGEQKLQTLLEAIVDLIYERASGTPVPSIIGVLYLAIDQIKKDAEEE